MNLVERLKARQETWYDGASQSPEWGPDALCQEAAAEITRLQKELDTAREDAARIAEESCTGREIDDMDIGWDAACMVIAEKIRRALKDKEVAG